MFTRLAVHLDALADGAKRAMQNRSKRQKLKLPSLAQDKLIQPTT